MILMSILMAASPACTTAGLNPADLTALRQAMVASVLTASPLPAAADTTLRAIEAKAPSCGTAMEPDSAKALAVASFTRAAIAERLTGSGVVVTRADTVLKATDRRLLARLVAKQFGTPGVAELASRVIATAGPKAGDPAARRLLGAYAINAARLMLAGPAASGL